MSKRDGDDLPYDGSALGFRTADIPLRSQVPKLLRETAKEMAGAFYEYDRRPIFRQTFQRDRDFVDVCWPNFVGQARVLLLEILHRPSTAEHVKNEIYDAVTNNFEERTKNSIKGVN